MKRISGLIYEETRGVLKIFLENVIRDSVTYTEHAKVRYSACLPICCAYENVDLAQDGYRARCGLRSEALWTYFVRFRCLNYVHSSESFFLLSYLCSELSFLGPL